MKKIMTAILSMIFLSSFSQTTSFVKTTEQFKNGQYVWSVVCNGQKVGEFWPIRQINLVTKQTDSMAFAGSVADIQAALGGIATAPDGMTGGSFGAYQMQGKSLSHGRPCGDGKIYDYGIVVVDQGSIITFTHAREQNVDSLYYAVKARKGTMFFLPSIMRNGQYLSSLNRVDKVLIRRETPAGVQVGVILFDYSVTYDKAREIATGLDRKNASTLGGYISKTTHIYMLDGGNNWGQSCKEVNGSVQQIGTRDSRVVTNYLVFY